MYWPAALTTEGILARYAKRENTDGVCCLYHFAELIKFSKKKKKKKKCKAVHKDHQATPSQTV